MDTILSKLLLMALEKQLFYFVNLSTSQQMNLNMTELAYIY